MKLFKFNKHVTNTLNFVNNWAYRAIWFVYQILIKILYSNKSPLYRSDLLSAGLAISCFGISCLFLAAGISQCYPDVPTESTSAQPLVNLAGVPNSHPHVSTKTVFDNPVFKAPPENTLIHNIHYCLLMVGMGCLSVGSFFLSVPLEPTDPWGIPLPNPNSFAPVPPNPSFVQA